MLAKHRPGIRQSGGDVGRIRTHVDRIGSKGPRCQRESDQRPQIFARPPAAVGVFGPLPGAEATSRRKSLLGLQQAWIGTETVSSSVAARVGPLVPRPCHEIGPPRSLQGPSDDFVEVLRELERLDKVLTEERQRNAQLSEEAPLNTPPMAPLPTAGRDTT